MKAVRIHDYGGPEVLEVEEVPRPQPGEGQVQIRVYAAGVNPADWKMRAGLMKQFRPLPMPWTPGLEGAGIVSEVGPGVTQFQVGQAVFGAFQATYAEYAVAPVTQIVLKPDSLTFEQAASIPVGALTAWGAVIDTAQVQPGQRVLVHGATGGVGLYALQLVHWKGAHAIATTSTANIELARTLGAEQVIDYTKEWFEMLVHDLDAVIDTVGGDLHQRSLKVLRLGGILVTVAGRLPADLGKAEGVRATSAGRASEASLEQIVRLVEAGQLKPVVGKVFTLAEARQAHELSQTGHGRGRIILKIAG
ncbi:MAG TPA: NADP-dependent oxidoreductase [Anaerolineales bacterium]